jgi:hypothetical protein
VRKYLDEGLEKGHIRLSMSPAGALIMLIPKKNRDLRPVINYRRLNALTIKDRIPFLLITEIKD